MNYYVSNATPVVSHIQFKGLINIKSVNVHGVGDGEFPKKSLTAFNGKKLSCTSKKQRNCDVKKSAEQSSEKENPTPKKNPTQTSPIPSPPVCPLGHLLF